MTANHFKQLPLNIESRHAQNNYLKSTKKSFHTWVVIAVAVVVVIYNVVAIVAVVVIFNIVAVVVIINIDVAIVVVVIVVFQLLHHF